MATASTKPQLPALTGVRYLAALHVLVFHVVVMFVVVGSPGAKDAGLFEQWCAGGAAFFDHFWYLGGIALSGFIAVSFFFTLSGFILTYTSSDDANRAQVDRRKFWVARFARIYPVYFAGLLFNVPIFVSWLASQHPPLTPGKSLAVAGSALALVQSWWPLAAAAWNPPGWSLSVEAFFYFVFPWLILLVDRLPRRSLLAWLAVGWGAALCSPLVYMALDPEGLGSVYYSSKGTWLYVVEFNPALRLPEFFAGMVLGKLFGYRVSESAPARPGGGLLSIIAAGTLLGVLAYSAQLPILLLYNGLLLPLFLLLIYGLALGGGPLAWILSRRGFVLLGEASYAVYILHGGVIAYTVVYIWWALGGEPELKRQLGLKEEPRVESREVLSGERGIEPRAERTSNASEGAAEAQSDSTSTSALVNANAPTPLGVLFGCALVTTLGSIFVHKFLEVPSRRFLRNKLGGRRKPIDVDQPADLP